MSNQTPKNLPVLVSGLVVKNFDVFEVSGEFWLKTKPTSECPPMHCRLNSYNFSCWLKLLCVFHADPVSDQLIVKIRELVIGRSVGSWSMSSPVTDEIEKHLVVLALTTWFEDWQSRRSSQAGSKVYQGRFGAFYKDFRDFTERNFVRRAITEFPRSANVLSRKLRELAPIIRRAGLVVSLAARDNNGRRITISAGSDDSDGFASHYSSGRNPWEPEASDVSDECDDLTRRIGAVLQNGVDE